MAKRRLADLPKDLARVDLSAGKVTLADMCERYLATCQNQKPKTLRRKTDIAARVKRDFPGGADVSISRVVKSTVESWLASYSLGSASYNLYLEFIRAVFALAVDDKLLADSPVDKVKGRRPAKPIRAIPSVEEFLANVAEIRAMPHSVEAKDTGGFVEFITLAGLVQAEAGSLTWADIDFEKGRITTFRHNAPGGQRSGLQTHAGGLAFLVRRGDFTVLAYHHVDTA
jgi:integrase